MSFLATFRGVLAPTACASCSREASPASLPPSSAVPRWKRRRRLRGVESYLHFSRYCDKRAVTCRVTESPTEPADNNDEEQEPHKVGETPPEITQQSEPQDYSQTTVGNQLDQANDKTSTDGGSVEQETREVGEAPPEITKQNEPQDDSQTIVVNQLDHADDKTSADGGSVGAEEIELSSGSPLPGVKPQQLDESIRIPKQTIDIFKDQVFGFDTFFVTSQEPYEAGVLFKGNLRGQAAKSYEKMVNRMQNKFGDQYKLFLLINPEDDKPVAVVVPRTTLQPEMTAVPEWFAAGAFGLVTIFTLLLRNVPALQSNLMSTFDNLELLKDGLSGAFVTALILGVHELSHILVAKSSGVKLGFPYLVPSWQIGSFGAITRIINIVPKREDLLKIAAAGPVAGFTLGLFLFLLGLILPPADGIGVIVDASVFHESFLVGGIAKLLLGDALKDGTPISVNPLVVWAWAGLLINAINSIPAGELDGGRISFSIWGRKVSSRLTSASIALLGLSSLFNDVAFYWVALIFFLQRGPIAPLSEEVTDPEPKYIGLGISVLLLGLLVCLPYPFPFSEEAIIGM